MALCQYLISFLEPTLSSGPVTTDEKVQKKNDVKARSMLLMTLPNEHLMTFNQYKDAKTLFAAIQTRFGGNEATKKTQKTLLKVQKINTHVVVWRNKLGLDTMSFDDLYNNFKIVEQEVKRTASSRSSSSSQNMTFVSSPSSTNEVNTTYGVSTANTQVSTASTQVSTANLSDATVYAFLANQPNRSQLVYEDLEQIHEEDVKEKILKWQLHCEHDDQEGFLEQYGRKDHINGVTHHWIMDNSNVRVSTAIRWILCKGDAIDLRTQIAGTGNQDKLLEDCNCRRNFFKAMVAIDGAGFDWSYMADDEVSTNMALMAFSDSEFNKFEFNLATYKRVLTSVEVQLVFYKKNELENLKQEKESNQLKIENFDNASKRLFLPPNLDLSYSGLEEFQQPEFEGYGPKTSKSVSEDISNEGHPKKEDQGYVDSGCSRHMTGNMSYLSDFKEFDKGYVIEEFDGGYEYPKC
ncbi:hypothetical protein Tco_0993367 [Tanacetum coccineum]|uniref:Uncharacterized protein n=1 Tax=Tanacetum coccineum TaxID=301880 RepID=A0ABQ5F5D1_9ASTR